MAWQALAAAGMVGLEYLNAKNQAEEQNRLHVENWQRASQAQNLKIQQLNKRAIQESEAIAQSKFDLAIATLENQERRAVVGGETGLSGSAIDNFIKDPMTKRLRAETKFKAQEKAILDEIELQKIGVTSETENRIASVPMGQEPDIMMYAAKAALGAAMAHFGTPSATDVAKEQLAVQAEAARLSAIQTGTFVGPMPAPQPNAWTSIQNFFQ